MSTMNIGMEALELDKEEQMLSFESLAFDLLTVQEDLSSTEDELHTLENCLFLRDHIEKHGVDEVALEMLDNQIAYDSVEDLKLQLDAAIEGFFGNLLKKAGSAVASYLGADNQYTFDRYIAALKKKSTKRFEQQNRMSGKVNGPVNGGYLKKDLIIPDIIKYARLLKVLEKCSTKTERNLRSEHMKLVNKAFAVANASTIKVASPSDLEASLIPAMEDLNRNAKSLADKVKEFHQAIALIKKEGQQHQEMPSEKKYEIADLVKWVHTFDKIIATCHRKCAECVRKANAAFGVHSDDYIKAVKKYGF